MAEQTFNLPDLGEGLTEADIIEWLVTDGDEVAIDQHVVVVETAKASVEVPCPYAGRVHTRHGAEGDTIAVGSPLLTVASGSAATTSDAKDGSGAVLVGYGTTDVGGSGSSGRRAARRRQHAGTATPPTTPSRVPGGAPRVISPIVRRMAADQGLDLRTVTPGPDGVIRRSDVESAVAGLDTPGLDTPGLDTPGLDTPPPLRSPGTRPAAPLRSPGTRPASTGDTRVALTGIRRMVADKLTISRREIPDATTWVDADATGLVEARRAIGLERGGLLALLGRICVAGLGKYPELNSSVDTERQEIVRHGAIHLGFAADSPRGLVVPVVHDADRLTTRQLAERMVQLVDAAREGTLSPADLTGGTFTLNNYGVFGVDGSTPIINHPEAAMLGVGRIIDRPWVIDGQLAVRKVAQLGLTFDHRVCDGGVAGGFLRFVADAVERPLLLLGEV
ncbi:dihydrolipoamide acetyltransferase family protein [Flexivirga alba]|uniref:Dihydrolipoamide acetyltransferase component of pyruvate dehydrogenase complex n=1 Tax=Flexivirga alba TaxID=702742 RepID=A0ABW2ACC4_9MICO